MTPGAQYLVDELETLLNQDFPQQPPQAVRIALFICAAASSVLLGAYFSQALLLLGAVVIFVVMAALCFFYPIIQLWPVTAVMVTYSFGAVQVVAMQLILGARKGKILSEILPRQVLDQLEKVDSFRSKQCNVVVLMSDLAGYTTVTELLKKPEYVMDLMNDYLGSTSIVLQKEYNGILEAYVGDMVCYYWEYEAGKELAIYKQVLDAAIKLALLQKNFFSSVADRYKELLTPDVLKEISTLINAGIGITAGTVVKGNLGPKTGLKKFAILGDPINLASRIESLTRHFNTEIIVTGDFAKAITVEDNLAVRRLGSIKVKGRSVPEVLYALGETSDPRFMAENIKVWEQWIAQIEKGTPVNNMAACPDIYSKDRKTVLDWREKGVMGENGVWQLHEK
jgi:adenylate cyclase